jgi:hypothetical protein
LELAAEGFYKALPLQRSAIYEDLAALPFALCITTTPDDLLVNAFRHQKKDPRVDYYHFREGRPDRVGVPSAAQPLVYRLFGSFADSSSLVLSETDLLDFLVNSISKSPELPPGLVSQFREHDKDISFLFIGFGFQRWYLRILLHMLRKQLPQKPQRSLALEDEHFFSHPEREKTSLFFDHAQAIEFKHCTWRELASELKRQYLLEEGQSPRPLAVEPPADAPTVFLCHSSENREAVAAFGEKLRAHGINTWRDRDNLRGGDDWDRKLKHVIAKQVTYFLVLQTPIFNGKSERYFFTEIKEALERQSRQPAGTTFVIPAFFHGDSCNKLEQLEFLNYLDLRSAEGFEQLKNAILEDQRNRREGERAA